MPLYTLQSTCIAIRGQRPIIGEVLGIVNTDVASKSAEGNFLRGSVVEIYSDSNVHIATGIVNYDLDEIEKIPEEFLLFCQKILPKHQPMLINLLTLD